MTIFTIFFTVLGIMYVLLGILLIAGVLRIPRTAAGYQPFVSIIIPVRNEAHTIIRCLDSLAALDYPHNKIEIIVIDDHSEDDTAQMVQSRNAGLTADIPIRCITLASLPEKRSGKISALAEGYQNARGEIIFQTDADCVVPPKWIQELVRQFTDRVGAAGGITLMRYFNKPDTVFTHLQSLDMMYLIGAGIGARGIGATLSCFGNNIAVKKSAYEAFGGYESIPFTFTEDFALVQGLAKRGWNIGYTLSEDAVVYSRATETLLAFINQRLRWLSGGLRYTGKGIILLSAAFLLHICMLIGMFTGVNVYIFFGILSSALLTDFIFLYLLAKKINKKYILRFFLPFEFYYIICTTIFGLMLPFATALKWKGRRY